MTEKRIAVPIASVLIVAAGVFYFKTVTSGGAPTSLEAQGLHDAANSENNNSEQSFNQSAKEARDTIENTLEPSIGNANSGNAVPVQAREGAQMAGSITQTIPFASDVQRQAVAAAFLSRTGMTVNIPDVNIFGYIMRAQKTPGTATGAAPTQNQALQEATRFLQDNASALGYSDRDVEAAKGQVNPGELNGSWYVAFSGAIFPPGYERFPSVQRHLLAGFEIGTDGHVFAVINTGASVTDNNLIPGLNLPTTPRLRANDPSVSAAVVGQKLQWVTGGDEGEPRKTKDFGAIEPADIQSKDLSIYENWNVPGALILNLAYDFRIVKGGHTWSILIDAGNGTQLQWSQIDD